MNTEAANLHDVMSRYLRLVGEPPPTVMFAPGLLSRGFPTEEADALELAIKHNPSLRIAMENVDAAQYELQARRGTLHPRVEFRMSSENSNNLEGVAGHRQDNKVGILLNFNLFNGGADMARQSVSVERRISHWICERRRVAICAKHSRLPTTMSAVCAPNCPIWNYKSARSRKPVMPTKRNSTLDSAPCWICSTPKANCSTPVVRQLMPI
ncbi:MAG: TolC family protein [Rhodocyclaceae bacterium]|nr:TolC family protein [Rhodocyclaceae bacterium]